IEVGRQRAIDFAAKCRFDFVPRGALVAGNAANGMHEDVWGQVRPGNPRRDRTVRSMKGKARSVPVQRGGMHRDNGGGEEIDPVFIADATVEAIKSAAVVGPVADTDDALTAELQFLAAGEDIDRDACRTSVKIEVALAKVEFIAHVGLNRMGRQAERMGVNGLKIGGKKAGGPDFDRGVVTCELVNTNAVLG